eukprot:scaffold2257_cov424-Pavlova_lutheri.AAC.5
MTAICTAHDLSTGPHSKSSTRGVRSRKCLSWASTAKLLRLRHANGSELRSWCKLVEIHVYHPRMTRKEYKADRRQMRIASEITPASLLVLQRMPGPQLQTTEA